MGLGRTLESWITAAMAVVMVFSMTTPTLSVYAAARTIIPDTGDGPSIGVGGNSYTANSINLNEGNYLKDMSGFSDVPLEGSAGHNANANDP